MIYLLQTTEDIEHQFSDYIHCNGQFVFTTSDHAIEQYKEQVRAVRNSYLEQTDKFMIVDYPITDVERKVQGISYLFA